MFQRVALHCLLVFTAAGLFAENTPRSVLPVAQDAAWTSEWWMPRHEAKLAEKDRMQRVDLVFLGDSITHGWENKGQKFWETYYGDQHALNLGFSGDRTEHVLWRLNHGEIDGIHPKLLVLMIGTNNTGQHMDAAEDTALGIRTLLDTIEVKLPETKILLLAIFPRGAEASDPMRVRNEAINAIIQTYADNDHVFYLNINDAFLNENGVLSKNVMSDLLHPNADQYEVWAEAIQPKLKELMQQ